ncbi:hypothetical protein ACFP3Q_14465 [Nocardioides sp. GCM10027113]|uniref:hypothetical protein n=1 Tax=unclassified Nocardioides TaxID=2615069 RepID=UPI00360EE48C
MDDEIWNQNAATFFGLGYRTSLPVIEDMEEPVNFHRGLAAKLASALGRTFDPAPWDFIEAGNLPAGGAVEVVGGWPSPGVATGGGPGDTPWSAITQVAPAAHDASYGAGVSLPWPSNPLSALAGLPTLSRLEDQQAERHVQDIGAAVGLWWSTAEHLTGSTAGVPMIQTGRRSWIFPDRSAGTTPSWVFFNIANALSAVPGAITIDAIRSSKAAAFITGTGAVTVIETLDGTDLAPDREQVLTLLTTRLRFLA